MPSPIVVELKVLRSVSMDEFLGGPLRDYWNRVMLTGHADAVKHAPVDTGLLRSSTAPGGGATEIDGASLPTWATVGTDVATYPAVLNNWDVPHYRAGPHGGEPTKGWLSDGVDRIRGEVDGHVQQLASDVEAAWRG